MKCYCDECVYNINRKCVRDTDIWINDDGVCAFCVEEDDFYAEADPLEEGEENEK